MGGRGGGSSEGISPACEVADEGGGGRGTPIQFFFYFHAVLDSAMFLCRRNQVCLTSRHVTSSYVVALHDFVTLHLAR